MNWFLGGFLVVAAGIWVQLVRVDLSERRLPNGLVCALFGVGLASAGVRVFPRKTEVRISAKRREVPKLHIRHREKALCAEEVRVSRFGADYLLMEAALESKSKVARPVKNSWAELPRSVRSGLLVTAAVVVTLVALFVVVPYFFGTTVESCGGIWDPLTGEHLCDQAPEPQAGL